ncbi:hypothetical protein ACFZAM_31935 [Streptomyces sp. NPDC008079]|uniref:hypothetical protein n=1 Tax=Streptomyces sp. NPDC008079 TaxID=3364806 RepID=UPI0036E25A52
MSEPAQTVVLRIDCFMMTSLSSLPVLFLDDLPYDRIIEAFSAGERQEPESAYSPPPYALVEMPVELLPGLVELAGVAHELWLHDQELPERARSAYMVSLGAWGALRSVRPDLAARIRRPRRRRPALVWDPEKNEDII